MQGKGGSGGGSGSLGKVPSDSLGKVPKDWQERKRMRQKFWSQAQVQHPCCVLPRSAGLPFGMVQLQMQKLAAEGRHSQWAVLPLHTGSAVWRVQP